MISLSRRGQIGWNSLFCVPLWVEDAYHHVFFRGDKKQWLRSTKKNLNFCCILCANISPTRGGLDKWGDICGNWSCRRKFSAKTLFFDEVNFAQPIADNLLRAYTLCRKRNSISIILTLRKKTNNSPTATSDEHGTTQRDKFCTKLIHPRARLDRA